MSNVSAVVNYFPTVNESFTASTSGITASGATEVSFVSMGSLVNGSIFVGIIEPAVTAKQQTFTGTVDTTNSKITGVKWTRGTNTSHASGVTVVDYVTGTTINMITAGILKQHSQTGAHTAVTATSLAVSGSTSLAAVSATTGTFSSDVSVTGQHKLTSGTTVTHTSNIITPTKQVYSVTGLTGNITLNAPSFTAWDGAPIVIRIYGASSYTFALSSSYTNVSGLATPTATPAAKWLTIGAMYNSAVSKWQVVSISTEA